MSKNIVICCDGTGNEISRTLSNVLKLFRVLEKNNQQRVYYSPGIGTIDLQNNWQRFKQKIRGLFRLATGYGLDDDVLRAYCFLCNTYQAGDRIWLFGFSRGAYTVRVLAAFIHVIGVLSADQLNLAAYAFTAYKKPSDYSRNKNNKRTKKRSTEINQTITANLKASDGINSYRQALENAWHFSRVANAKPIEIEFIGVWDTVSSILCPHKANWLPSVQTLCFTRRNPSVKTFRQAMALDERRRMFRLNAWQEKQYYRPNPTHSLSEVSQDIRQVWFAGSHTDIGGGYPENESGLSKFPLLWMIEEAASKGLLINRTMVNHLILGQLRIGSKHHYVVPDVTAPLHNSMTLGWKILELFPKRMRWRESINRRALFGWYLPLGEPRVLANNAIIHQSVFERIKLIAEYLPVNLPGNYAVEPMQTINQFAEENDKKAKTVESMVA